MLIDFHCRHSYNSCSSVSIEVHVISSQVCIYFSRLTTFSLKGEIQKLETKKINPNFLYFKICLLEVINFSDFFTAAGRWIVAKVHPIKM